MNRVVIAGLVLAVGSFAFVFLSLNEAQAEDAQAAAAKPEAAAPKAIEKEDAGVTGDPAPTQEPVARKSTLKWAEKHYGIDVMTTATATKWVTGEGAMPRQELEAYLQKILDGKRMYILTTSLNDKPLTTTIEYGLDPEQMVLFGASEKPTEKLFHMEKNPYVSLNYYKNHAYPDETSLQIRGSVKLFTGPYPGGKIPDEMRRFLRYYKYQYMAWFELSAKNVPMAISLIKIMNGIIIPNVIVKTMDVSRIEIEQIVLQDRSLLAKGYNMRQLWVRNP